MSGNQKRIDGRDLLEKKLQGTSSDMRQIRNNILLYASIDKPVLLLGETGTGKSHVAELLHALSGRPGKFVTVPVPNINGELFESKLFGHKKGAFTDAKEDRAGFVDEARGGTLFFDEISEIPLDFQVKLLRFIETKCYYVLGDPKEKTSDIRVVAATNRDLKAALKTGEFRNDLYYRLNIFPIFIPPLRERPEDIRELVKKYGHPLVEKKFSNGFWEALASHPWGGNVRELQTVLDRLFILPCNQLTGEDVKKCLDCIDRTPADENEASDDAVQNIWIELMSVKTFWEVVKKPFMARNINRSQVKQVLGKVKEKSGKKIVDFLSCVNLSKADYSKFKSFLYRNKIIDRSSEL